MPKLKTHKGASKRFKRTASGKFLRGSGTFGSGYSKVGSGLILRHAAFVKLAHSGFFVRTLQQELIREELLPQDHDLAAHTELLPMQPGDVLATYADTSPLERDFGFRPATPLREGLRRFARWYRAFYGSQS